MHARAAGGIGAWAVCLGAYNFDSHNAQRLACRNASACGGGAPHGTPAGAPFAWDEGDVETSPGTYQIPLWVMLPKAEEARNLLVVAAPSASHIGMSTLRMEPQFMMLGHAAGIAAKIAFATGAPVQQTDLQRLHGGLLGDGMVLYV